MSFLNSLTLGISKGEHSTVALALGYRSLETAPAPKFRFPLNQIAQTK